MRVTLPRIAAAILLFSAPAEATPPKPDLTVRIDRAVISSHDANGVAVRLELRFDPAANQPIANAALEVRLFDYHNGIESGERLLSRQNFTNAIPPHLSVPMRLTNKGTYVVEAKVNGGEPGQGFSHVDRVYLLFDGRAKVSLVAPAAFKHRENSENAKKFGASARPKPKPLSSNTWNLSVAVVIQYVDSSGNTVPLPNATVEIWESDIFLPDFLGTVITDSAGRASRMVAVPTDPLGPDDIYLKVKTLNGDRFTLGTASGPSSPVTPYVYQSGETRVNVGQGAVSIPFTITNGARELGVWSIFNSIRDYIAGQIHFAGKAFNIWFPCSVAEDAYFSETDNLIAIGDNYAKSEMVIAHEYGHDLMWLSNNEWSPEAGGEHSFCPSTPIDNKLAWTEGYATAFALSATNSPDGVFHWTPGDSGRDIEHYSCSYHQLDTDEGRVAAAIWDFVDANNDCNQGSQDRGRDGFCDQNQPFPISPADAYYNAVKDQQQETVMPYWWNLHDHFMNANQQPLAEDIMRYDWSDYDSSINVFESKCNETSIRCQNGVYNFTVTWNANAHACELYAMSSDYQWFFLRSTQCVGTFEAQVQSTRHWTMKLRCTGWKTLERVIHEPPIYEGPLAIPQ